jgi:hypothetical protein
MDIPQVLAIAGALQDNKGLVDLNLSYCCWASDDTWNAICDSLKTHPTLKDLDLCSLTDGTTTSAVVTSWIQALLDMMKMNRSIHTIRFLDRHREHEHFRRSVIPHLATNQFRLRVRANQRTLPITYRANVLSRALLVTRTDANSLWMLLSGNAEVVAFATTTVTTTLAENLPTSTTAATTVNVAPIIATASVTVTCHIVAPASGQKHKAYP